MIDGRHPLVRLARPLAGLHARYHRASLEGLEHLPKGAALLVGNHGIYGLETPPFFYLLHAHTGRFAIGLADKTLFGVTPIRQLLRRIGGVPGTRENALALLRAKQLVVCYPGGSRETFKAPTDAYRLRWERTTGFAQLALDAGVPIVPFAGAGIDDTYLNYGAPAFLRARLGRYAPPLGLGLGPLPMPVRLRFRLGAPITACAGEQAGELKLRVQSAVEALLHTLRGHAPPRLQPAFVP